ncbi:class I adenylate-forming enzyme family protein [Brevibacterium luteolum]|uniref:Fatty-acid--CoA ligase n=1 Tax=Brevibacterium luteolum TaxID=199591 RepID=A0A2N6PH94_9MICO|nr:AMP-binding protein [Brevibacterium luteolum]PMB98055.1 fatty-acid--CoA ligase [Brevibacterium luteolum]
MKLTTMLEGSVERFPEAEALVAGDIRLTFAQFQEQSLRAAAYLRKRGVGPGSRVGIMAYNVPGFAIGAFGVWYLGATLVPLNHKMQAPEVEYTVNHAELDLGIVSPELLETAMAGAPDTKWITTDPATGELDEAIAQHEPLRPDQLPELHDEDVAQILYTSGTTSAPRGCVHSHRSIAQAALLIALNLGFDSDDRYLIAMPLWHSAPLNICFMPMIAVGGTTVLHREYHPVETMKLIQSERTTTFFGPPIAYLAPMMAAKQLEQDFSSAYDFSSMRRWLYGGAPTDAGTLRRLISGYESENFYNVFGMSEMGPTGCFLRPEDQLRKAGSIGRAAMIGNRMRVVDADGRDAGPGQTGEVWFAGDTRMREYLNDPQATAAVFEGDWYRTGDVARIDEDGFLYIVDRLKDVIIVGGENVYSLEVEEAISSHPRVADVAVVGRPDPDWGEQIVAFVTTSDGEELGTEELRDHLAGSLARYKIPREVVIAEALPRNPSGKLLKHVLRSQVSEDPGAKDQVTDTTD